MGKKVTTLGILMPLLFAGALSASAAPAVCATRSNDTSTKLLDCVTLEGVREHQAAFQTIAQANGGNRAHGTSGYAASVNYVVQRLTAAGWRVSRSPINITAELAGRSSRIVMAGAHLDSVPSGPGINDNGSGAAALLEVAEQLGRVKPLNTIRLAWWGGEEQQLLGSRQYVADLSQGERNRIAGYLNFDMIGSPNPGLFVYDGDDSDGLGAGPGPQGSAQIEQMFVQYFSAVGLATLGYDLDGRSDYVPFAEVGIPIGGIFTGAEKIKTAAQVALWDGTAGIAYDPCYHLACDSFANVNTAVLNVTADAMAYTVLQYAMRAL